MKKFFVLFFLCFISLAPSCLHRTAESFFSDGEQKYDQRNYSGAIKYYSIAIKKNPEYRDAYWKRGLCKAYLDSLQSAIRDYDKAIELKPTGETYFYRGSAKWELSDSSGACTDWESACALQFDKGCDFQFRHCH